MLLDKEIKLNIQSSRIIGKLKELGIESKIGDIIYLPIDKLWLGCNSLVRVKCDICDSEKELSFANYNLNYTKHKIYCCSNECATVKNKITKLEKYGDENYVNSEKANKTKLEKYGEGHIEIVEKIKKTKLERYNDENYNNREGYKQTNMEKYGKENTFEVEEFIEKTKKTNLERYGVEDSRTSDFVKEKRKLTNLERYGVENVYQSEEIRNNIKEIFIGKYGFDSPNKSPIIKDKKIQTMLDKYGCISNSLTEESKKKLRDTNLEKYGVEYPMQVEEFAIKQQKSAKKIEYFNDELYYQGSYEKDFLEYMDNLGLLYLIKRGKMVNYEFEGKIKMHYPDFYLEKLNLIIEIKSSYFYDKFLEKNKIKMETCITIGYNYIFIINKNYSIIDLILKNLLNDNL